MSEKASMSEMTEPVEMRMDKQAAKTIINMLEETASSVEQSSSKLNPQLATVAGQIVRDLDLASDRIEIAAFGKEAFEKRRAEVLQRDKDEPWMDTFENVQKPIITEKDEPYMHESGKSYNGKSIKTYDSDDSSQVRHRDEHEVRELSEWADKTKQQPSWEKGPAGKSTRQGSAKTWA